MITASQIRAGRALLNAKQSELAEIAGISLATLNNIERGLGDPRTSTLRAIEEALEAAGVFVESDTSTESVFLKKFDRPSAYDSFTASQRVLEIFSTKSLIKIESLLFYMRQSNSEADQGPRVCLLINGRVRHILFDQVGFNLENPARIAEVAGIMLAAIVRFPSAVYYCTEMLEDTTLSSLDDAVNHLKKLETPILSNPKDFLTIQGDWDSHFGPSLKVKGHPLQGLLDYVAAHPV